MDTEPRTYDFGKYGKLTFSSRDEFATWVSQEREFWNFLGGHAPDIREPFLGQLNAMQRWAVDGKLWDDDSKSLGGPLGAFANVAIYSKSPEGQLIGELNETKGPEAAVAATAVLVDKFGSLVKWGRFEINSAPAMAGAFEAMLFKIGMRGAPESRIALEAIYKEFSEKQTALIEETRNALNAAADARKEMEAERATFLTSTATDRETAKNDLKAIRDSATKTIENNVDDWQKQFRAAMKGIEEARAKALESFEAIKIAHETAVRLQAPVAYWRRKRLYHTIMTIGFGVAFAIALGYGGSQIVGFLQSTLPHYITLKEGSNVAPVEGPSGAPMLVYGFPLQRLGISILVVTLGLWALRTLARLFLSNLHLATDAAERVVMVQTLLALNKEGITADAKDREMMVVALFRRATTGIVKEDADPPLLWASVLKGRE